MNFLRFGNPRLEAESDEVVRLSRELQDRIREYEKQPDPFRALTITMASNAYEERQERNIWRGQPTS